MDGAVGDVGARPQQHPGEPHVAQHGGFGGETAGGGLGGERGAPPGLEAGGVGVPFGFPAAEGGDVVGPPALAPGPTEERFQPPKGWRRTTAPVVWRLM